MSLIKCNYTQLCMHIFVQLLMVETWKHKLVASHQQLQNNSKSKSNNLQSSNISIQTVYWQDDTDLYNRFELSPSYFSLTFYQAGSRFWRKGSWAGSLPWVASLWHPKWLQLADDPLCHTRVLPVGAEPTRHAETLPGVHMEKNLNKDIRNNAGEDDFIKPEQKLVQNNWCLASLTVTPVLLLNEWLVSVQDFLLCLPDGANMFKGRQVAR